MSDVFPGPGWWLASDGKWYEPQSHPDENYRARYPSIEGTEALEPPVVEELDEPEELDDAHALDEPEELDDAAEQVGDELPSVEILPPAENADVDDESERRLDTVMRSASLLRNDLEGSGANGVEAIDEVVFDDDDEVVLDDDDEVVLDDDDDLRFEDPVIETLGDASEEDDAPEIEAPEEDEVPESDALGVDETSDAAGGSWVAAEVQDEEATSSMPENEVVVENEQPPAEDGYVTVRPSDDVFGDLDSGTETVLDRVAEHGADKAAPVGQVDALDRVRRERLAKSRHHAAALRRQREAESTGESDSPTALEIDTEDVSSPVVGNGSKTLSAPGAPVGVAGRTRLEIDPPPNEEAAPASSLGLVVPAPISESTELVHVPADESEPIELIDRLLSFLVFCGGLAMVVGTFMAWVVGSGDEIGWGRPDGFIAVGAGVAAAVSAGPLWVGFRHPFVRGLSIFAGLIGLLVVVVLAATTLSDNETTGLTLGPGIAVVAAGAVAATIAGLATPKDSYY